MFITHHAGIRSAAKAILAGKIIDNDFFEVVGFIDDIVRDSETVSHTTGIGYGRGTAALVFRAGDAILRPHLHRHADDFPAILL
jgi:hypothetical protein